MELPLIRNAGIRCFIRAGVPCSIRPWNHLALLDTLPAIPLDLNQIVYVEDWMQESSCLLIPREEM